MSRIRTVVVDDEKPARVRLTELLQREPDIEVVGTASDGREAIELLRRNQTGFGVPRRPDPQLDGLAVLRQLTPAELPVTIMVTAYDKYAIQAFDAHAIDYLLKPFSDQRFDNAITRARRYLASPDMHTQAEELGAAAEERRNVDTRSGCLERVALKTQRLHHVRRCQRCGLD